MGRRREPKPRKVTIIRYEDPQGRRCAKGAPGAVRRKVKSDTYYLHLPPRSPGLPRERIPLETTDLTVAWKRVRDILERRQKEELGILDDHARQLGRPIAEHVEDWLTAVAAGKVTAKRVTLMRARIGRLLQLTGWKRIGDIRKSSCQVALNRLQSPEEGHVSAQTRNHYLSHIRQFCRWLRDEQRLPADPLAGLKGISVEDDRRHDRRSPDDFEVRVLFEHLAGADPTWPPLERCGMSGPQRALGYQVSMCSGLRAGELRSLTPASLDLDTGEVRVRAGREKRRRRTLQPLPRWLCEAVRAWLAAGGGLWERFPADWPGRLLEADLGRAREGWIQAAGDDQAEHKRREASTVCVYRVQTEDGPLFWDFHSLRHWYVSQVAAIDGISPSTMQALVRHADPKLTLRTYAKARQGDVRRAADSIRIPGAGKEEA